MLYWEGIALGMFGFDERFAMFDSTPVENYFLLEYMPKAKGDYVKVYLYGLMNCYHPQADMSLAQMARELELDEETVLSAYRYWEKRRLVQRVSDHPLEYRYMNIKYQMLMGGEVTVDQEYESFCEMVHAAFNYERSLRTNELMTCFDWVKELHLQPETVVLLIGHMIALKGKNFSIKAAEKVAVMLAEQGALTIDDAALVLERDKLVQEGSRSVLRRLGMRREPTQDEMELYQKWLNVWGYKAEAIEAACAETTKSRTPSFAYLDGILAGMMERSGKAAGSKQEVEQQRSDEQERIAPLKQLLATLNVRDVGVNDGTIAVYADMRSMYPDEVIQLAARECARRSGKLEDVMAMLESWQRKSLQTLEDAQAYVRKFREQGKLLRILYEEWGTDQKPNAADRALLQKWQDEWHFDNDMIAFCSIFASGVDKPMPYLDKLLEAYQQQGVRTQEAAVEARRAWQQRNDAAQQTVKPAAARTPKAVREQQYGQRPYENTVGMPDWMRARLEALNDDEE